MNDYIKIWLLYGLFTTLGISAVILGANSDGADGVIYSICGWVMIASVLVFVAAVMNQNRKKK